MTRRSRRWHRQLPILGQGEHRETAEYISTRRTRSEKTREYLLIGLGEYRETKYPLNL
ncbi:hypothetical protein M405DRAFT_820792 [Rhizopogon salebrosus TDB-379]|nr:hypothetical protein M405DRAFT_820792 [Rhizopogon salebrosus TDB-379]